MLTLHFKSELHRSRNISQLLLQQSHLLVHVIEIFDRITTRAPQIERLGIQQALRNKLNQPG